MSEVDLAALAADVRYLKDRTQIIDALNRYTRGLDRMDRELAMSAFHPDATDDRDAPYDTVGQKERGRHPFGREARIDWLMEVLKPYKYTAHYITNFTIDIQGDEAHTETYVITAVLETEPGDWCVLGGARYIDRLVRYEDRWVIMHREVPLDFNVIVGTRRLPPETTWSLRNRDDRSYARPLTLKPESLARFGM
ncbi:nuclear transport factor 2 family protein [Sphingobium nicotianae]|uniref:Nuclear transport factor 2 family protein n=1 Tax=Sphingobium nicotianae TaxID=2782607 RepID=A0A9X1DBG7_9SPHN|nr:nuclear transport factor 2 family protein [Sphingobium nicotianae]MBT2186874.1 nuclear transport factor 2 family protein [Sphingobium nicotianae]